LTWLPIIPCLWLCSCSNLWLEVASVEALLDRGGESGIGPISEGGDGGGSFW
ncbi:hypothetical protein C1H46_028098, partial [Malus baccata]